VNIDRTYGFGEMKREHRLRVLEPELDAMIAHGLKHDYNWFINLSNRLYEEGMTCLDIIQLFEEDVCKSHPGLPLEMYRVHFCFNKIKSEFRCEKMLMMYLFDYMFLRLDRSLKNVSFL
jgi:hypothetical protein